MKKHNTFLFALLLSSGAGLFAGQAELRLPRTDFRKGTTYKTEKRAEVVKVVPHLAASTGWKSMVILRNDLDRVITLSIDFYANDGDPASAVFYDSDETQYTSSQITVDLAPFEIYTLEFDRMVESGLVNLSAFIFSDELDQDYSVEVVFDNFQGQDKVASVGGGIPLPGESFFMNLDERNDAYTNNRKLRGLAIENIEVQPCICSVRLWDHLGVERQRLNITIGPLAKWVGTVGSLVNVGSLPKGLGLIDFDCSRLVSAVGLSFEQGTPIVGGTPIDYYVFEKNKRVPRQ
jgi:hypothetical protein